MDQNIHIMVVDDEEIVRDSLSSWLREDGYDVENVESGVKALERLMDKEWNLFLVDLKMPGMDGLQLLEEVKKARPDLPIIIITAYATVDTAVKAIKKGASDYLVKPFNPEDLSLTIKKILEHERLVKENIYLRQELKRQYRLHDLVSKNHKMKEIFELVRTVAGSNSTVLIQGESGTGKELIARAIHEESQRKDGPFVSVSCAALTETLLESELFGYEKGAFTGAGATTKGKFELAREGTLFLDEIGDISPKLQMDLLRVLEQKEFRRVGGSEIVKVDARILAATNRDIKKAVEEGRFRDDLYYRLNVISIVIPPLRERKEDIPILVEYFIDRFNIEMGKSVQGISEGAIKTLMDYDWPGNARELRNVIERAMVVAKGKSILEQEISIPALRGKEMPYGKSLDDVEREHIALILHQNRWNILRSAQMLGINRVTLYKKIKIYGLKREIA